MIPVRGTIGHKYSNTRGFPDQAGETAGFFFRLSKPTPHPDSKCRKKSAKGPCCPSSGATSSCWKRTSFSFLWRSGGRTASRSSKFYAQATLSRYAADYSGTVRRTIANRIGPMNCTSRLCFLYPQRRKATDAATPRTVSAGAKYRICCQTDTSATISLSTLTIKINGKATI